MKETTRKGENPKKKPESCPQRNQGYHAVGNLNQSKYLKKVVPMKVMKMIVERHPEEMEFESTAIFPWCACALMLVVAHTSIANTKRKIVVYEVNN